MNYAVILAAGSGERFGGDKLFEVIDDLPLLGYSIKTFQESDLIDEIVVAASKVNIKKIEELVTTHSFEKVGQVIEGGSERQFSVQNALSVIPNADRVIVHDAARPLADGIMIAKGMIKMDGYEAHGAIPVLPVSDTIKLVDDSIVERTVPRDRLFRVQTPQIFEYNILLECHSKSVKDGFICTDDASLLENYGYKVACFEGNRNNIKVTYKDDLDLVRYFISNV